MPGRLQAPHDHAAQSDTQHTPSEQCPVAHSPSVVHDTPFASFGAQLPAVHCAPGAQSAATVQLVVHAPALHPHGSHGDDALAHVPAPSHAFCVTALPVHDAAPHGVAAGANCAQLPSPSHDPGAPHGVPAGSQRFLGSLPFWIAPHTPELPLPLCDARHELHTPSQSESQHTPSTQWPLAHSAPLPHVAPLGFVVTHAPALQ
jgi:hypothetical protein